MALPIFIMIYLIITLGIGIFSAKLVKTSNDFMLAGRRLSIALCAPSMFSTWYGSETIIGASSEFIEHGLLGVMEDPFGTTLCFLLIGLFIARPIYRMNVVTIVDFYRIKYGKTAEKIAAFFMITSYIGWIAAQFLAMAIIMEVIFHIPLSLGLIICCCIVSLYTVSGGMWSISINDFIQTSIIIFGLLFLSLYYLVNVDDPSVYFNDYPKHHFDLFPQNTWKDWCVYLTAWMTIGLGSIPQQDVFQRVMSAKSESVAVKSSYLSALMYICLGLLPLFLTLAFRYHYPKLQEVSASQVLLQGVLLQESVWIKLMFFGALLSAIMSSASGGLLAPATIIEENLIKPHYSQMSDQQSLFLLRVSVVLTAIISLLYALSSQSIYELVAESSLISLVSLLSPLLAGIYLKKSSPKGGLLSMILGPVVWLICKHTGFEVESVLFGLLSSMMGLVIGITLDTFERSKK